MIGWLAGWLALNAEVGTGHVVSRAKLALMPILALEECATQLPKAKSLMRPLVCVSAGKKMPVQEDCARLTAVESCLYIIRLSAIET